ncbi:MAG: glycosyltransferase family 39 protein [Anaerolineales bacterium]|nr:glycosyltransferase family 39 protein [Anaerolineales bacterium]
MTKQNGGNVNHARRALALIGVVCVLASQFLIFSKPLDDKTVFPPYIWLTAVGAILFGVSLLIKPIPFFDKVYALIGGQNRTFWLVAAFALSAVTTFAVVNLSLFSRINYIPIVTLWALSALAYLYGVWNRQLTFAVFVDWVKRNRVELLIILGVTLLAAVFRFYRLGQIPRVIDGDEGKIGLITLSTVNTDSNLANPFALWENFGAMYLHLINAAFELFGVNAFGLRFLPAVGGTLAIPAVYLLARWIGGRRIALIAALSLAFSHVHINFSRIASVAYIQGTWLAPLELYFLLSGLEKKRAWRTALSGILIAIHFTVYLTSQVIIALILIFIVLSALFYRQWLKERWKQVLSFFGSFILLMSPSFYYMMKNSTEFLNRLHQDGTFNGWLQREMSGTGQSALQILFSRFVHAFLSLTYYPAFDFYGTSSPTMSVVTSVLFFVGIMVALLRVRRRRYLMLNGYLWGATFAVGIFAVPPSADTYRMLMALPAATIMVALGLDQILDAFGFDWEKHRFAYVFSASAVLVSLMIFNLWTYYADFAGKCRFGSDLTGRFAYYLGDYAKSVDNENSIYLLSDSILFYGSHPSTDFISQRRKITNVPDSIDTLDLISGETILAIPNRAEELETWARHHPGGKLNYVYDCDKLILLAYRIQ